MSERSALIMAMVPAAVRSRLPKNTSMGLSARAAMQRPSARTGRSRPLEGAELRRPRQITARAERSARKHRGERLHELYRWIRHGGADPEPRRLLQACGNDRTGLQGTRCIED